MKNSSKERKGQNILKKFKSIGIFELIILFLIPIGIFANEAVQKNKDMRILQARQALGVSAPVVRTSPVNTPYLSPTPQPVNKTYIDPNPITNCGPGQNSGQYVKDKQSNCKNYVDCQIGTTWKLLTREKCTQEQKDSLDKVTNDTNKFKEEIKQAGDSFNQVTENMQKMADDAQKAADASRLEYENTCRSISASKIDSGYYGDPNSESTPEIEARIYADLNACLANIK